MIGFIVNINNENIVINNNDIFKKVHCKSANKLKLEQIDWLKRELEKSNRLGRKILVFGHYPIISNGFYFFHLVPIYNLLILALF